MLYKPLDEKERFTDYVCKGFKLRKLNIDNLLLLHCHVNILPNTGHQNNTTKDLNQKQVSALISFPPFKCCLSVVLYIEKRAYLQNSHVVFVK